MKKSLGNANPPWLRGQRWRLSKSLWNESMAKAQIIPWAAHKSVNLALTMTSDLQNITSDDYSPSWFAAIASLKLTLCVSCRSFVQNNTQGILCSKCCELPLLLMWYNSYFSTLQVCFSNPSSSHHPTQGLFISSRSTISPVASGVFDAFFLALYLQ